MRIQWILWLCILGWSTPTWALDGQLSWGSFRAPSGASYLETYFLIVGETLTPIALDSGYLAVVEMQVKVMQGDSVFRDDTFYVKSPILKHARADFDLIEQRRYALPAGAYTVTLRIKDEGDAKNTYVQTEKVEVRDYTQEAPLMSSVQLIERYEPARTAADLKHSFYKNGLLMQPMPMPLFPKHFSKLNFYIEVHNLDKHADSLFVFKYHIQDRYSRRILTDYFVAQRIKDEPHHLFFKRMDIAELPSGNYTLVIQLVNRDKEVVLEEEVSFFRNNPIRKLDVEDYTRVNVRGKFADTLTADEVAFALDAMRVVAFKDEYNAVVDIQKQSDLERQRQFIQSFWARRNEMNTGYEFWQFYRMARRVDATYRTSLEAGYETDRGTLIMKHGPPNEIIDGSNDDGVYPYEVWSYEIFNQNERNVEFIFYNPSSVPNRYELLHSTARMGPVQPDWRRLLSPTGRNVELLLDRR